MAIFKVRRNQRPQPAEVVAGIEEQMLVEAVRPVDVGVDAERVGRVDETEQVHASGPRALQVKAAIELVLAAKRLVEPRLHHVLMGVVESGHLIVVERSCRRCSAVG